jgi:hypothetical protein
MGSRLGATRGESVVPVAAAMQSGATDVPPADLDIPRQRAYPPQFARPGEVAMHAEPQKEHKWLEQLVGEWETEMEGSGGPDQPPVKHTGTESVRSLTVWVQCEGTVPGDVSMKTVMTLGYDPAKKKFVGTFIGSMMTNLWVYEGTLDEAGKKLTLDAEGPSFTEPDKTAKYKDTIEIVSPDHRTLSSQFRADDGTWHHFMTAHYRRKK